MIPESHLMREVKHYYDARADAIVELNKAVYEIVSQHASPDGPDAEWWKSVAYVAVWHMANKVNRNIKQDEGAQDARQGELYPGYKRLQRRYSIMRDDKQVLVPVRLLTDDEIRDKITEHHSMAAGNELHARELERFMEERNTH